LTKAKPNYYYRPISKLANVNGEDSTSQPKENNNPSALQHDNKGRTCRIYKKSIDSVEVKNVFMEDNGKPIDDLVDDARKKVEAPPKKNPRKTCIWSGRKVDSPKRNVDFSSKTKVHYFDRDDINLMT
nr:hypothetical protein [Tanacetum cinerariifolium]